MKQIFRKIDRRTQNGEVKLECSDAEDMWHVYNILAVGDTLRAPTIRKVQTSSSTGSAISTQKKMTLTIIVTKISYDAAGASMRVLGKNCTENEYVKMGQYHTVEIDVHRAFTIGKERWDSVFIGQLNTALNPNTDADLAAIIMQEGLAHVLIVSRSLTLTRARIEMNIPRKGKNAIFNRDGAMKKFFDAVYSALLTHIDLNAIKVILIASPGFVKESFYQYMNLTAARNDERSIIDNKAKFVLCHSSSGHKHAFQEVLSKPELQGRLAKTKAVGEVRALQMFHDMLANDELRAVYGPQHVLHAMDMGAIDVLLVTDSLFRSADIPTRKKYVALVENARKANAKIVVFSDQHVAGATLKSMSGIAAILRFPLMDLPDITEDDVESSDEESDDAFQRNSSDL